MYRIEILDGEKWTVAQEVRTKEEVRFYLKLIRERTPTAGGARVYAIGDGNVKTLAMEADWTERSMIRQAIKDAMRKRGMNPSQLAKATGVKPQTVAKAFSDTTSPRLKTVEPMMKVLGLVITEKPGIIPIGSTPPNGPGGR